MIEFVPGKPSVTRRVEPDGEIADQRKQIVATKRWVREVEEWCKRQPGRAPTFSEAVRILTERAIQAETHADAKR